MNGERLVSSRLSGTRLRPGAMLLVRCASLLLFFCFVGLGTAYAGLTITPVTWNVIGLDSNNTSVGPDTFQVGVRACNTGGATVTNVTGTFVWDSSNAFLNLSGANPDNVGALAAGACTDIYFPVTVTRTSSAYNTARRYHITVSGDSVASVSTPTPRELYVERLISQSRNSVVSLTGPTTVYVGQTYTYTLTADTATQGYSQLEAFINLSNVVFQVQSISTTYTAPAGATNNKFYADACGWDTNPLSANYRSCIGPANYPGGKVGGTVVENYTVKILSATGAPVSVNALILDFSGSSYHYNADFGGNGLTITAQPPPLTLAKSAAPSPVFTNGTVTYTLRVTNSGPANYTLADFVDTPPTSPGTPAYVASSSIFNGAAISNPTSASGKLTWSGSFLIPAGQSRNLTYQMTMPNTHGTYTNSAVAHFDVYQVDTTQDTTDNAPASASVVVQTPPNIALDKSYSANSSSIVPGTELTYTITFTNNGDTAANSFTIFDMIPANTVFKLGSVTYNAGTSGIAAPTVDYSNAARSNTTPPTPPAPWVAYTPAGAAGTLDPQVTYVRWRFASNIAAGASASVTFVVRIP
ncbi:MAG: hypothetical protein DMF64_09665 [Acidobacteria bacterium]|nr:MAG: hypothetical protein DMF64_09665 [Acidobacteriota bacterium]